MSGSPESEKINKINLELGDIIQIEAPENDQLNDKIFYINFISKEKINLIGEDKSKITLNLSASGELEDESIESINIISKPEEIGYARQNNLLPGIWIDIYFSGELPLVITGEITNLENDMIEVTTYPDKDVIYIDFAYMGIPEDLPIESINIREIPESLKQIEEPFVSAEQQFESIEDSDLVSLEQETPFRVQDVILEGDQIDFGESLDEVTQVVDIPESEQRFGIDKQTNDMLDELLSTIPNQDRTPSKLNKIHTIIERYKELRLEYSNFIPERNIIEPKTFGNNYKPLLESLLNFSQKLYWLLPISTNNKKVYNTEVDDDTYYIESLTLAQYLIEVSEIVENWKSNLVPEDQNKYGYMLKQFNRINVPFTNNNIENYIVDREVSVDLITMINTLGDEQSYVSRDEELIMSRFVSQNYSEGLNRLRSEIDQDKKVINTLIKATPNDRLLLKGILYLPFSSYKFSHINLPLTSILYRSSLNKNFLQYWRFLNKKTIINPYIVDNLNEGISFNDKNFLNNIKQFILDETLYNKEDSDLYKKFLNSIIPNTKELFNLIKDKINDELSFTKIVQYMEPFLVYTKNITDDQYNDIVKFLEEKIKDYKKNFVINNKRFLQIYNKLNQKESSSRSNMDIIIKLLASDEEISEAVFSAYNIKRENQEVTSTELFDKMIRIDDGRLFMSAISKISLDLMVSNVLDQFITIESQLEAEKEENDCKKYILSKKYFALDELQDDNNKSIYFDKKYDNTFYDIINEYKDQQESLSPEEFLRYLKDKLIETVGLNEKEAERDALAMIKKERPVIDGDYAILEEEGEKPKIYIRKDRKWVLDNSISQDLFVEGNKFFCESQFKCFEKDQKCETDKITTKNIQKKNLKKIIGEFDEKYRLDLQKIKTVIDNNYKYNLERIYKIIKVETFLKLRYNKYFEELGNLVDESDLISSPYEKLRDFILGESDFAKKQNNILQFSLKFTREAYQNEDQYWLYCKNTNTKLLPKFINDLAQVFISKGDFRLKQDIICAEQGTLSDDGDKWIDKYSGYTIKSIDLNEEEGYDDSGFKLQTKALLEEDAGNILLDSSVKEVKEIKEVANPVVKIIQNVVLSMSQQMGINIQNNMDFIIKNVLEIHRINLPSKLEYEAAILKAKKRGDKRRLPSYEEASDSSLLILIFVFILVAIQISIPSIRTLKTFPGCIRSFSGYPLDGRTDKTAITYIACVANKISSTVKPWNSIYKSKESSIVKKMENIIDEYVLENKTIKELFTKKLEFLTLEESKIIPDEVDVKLWFTFLPPLISFKIKDISPFSESFKQELLQSIKTGSKSQLKSIDIVKSKIIRFSLLIQEEIQKVVNEQKPILTNINGDPFLENACCSENNNTIEFFINADPSIVTNNNQVLYLSNIIYDIVSITYAPLFLDPRNTRAIYPVINPEFTENIIYKTFIYYCRFTTNLPIDEELRAICQEKPDYLKGTYSLEEQIKLLKTNGRNFTIETFNQLINFVSSKNIIKINFGYKVVSNFTVLREYITYLDEKRSEIFPNLFLERLSKLVDSYDLFYSEDNENVREMKNYLSKQNELYKEMIDLFIGKHGRLNKSKLRNLINCLDNINSFKENNINQNISNLLIFAKTGIYNLINVLPNIVINKIDYDNVLIPRHWNLSERHNNDIKLIIKQYYNNLSLLYGDEQINEVCRKIQLMGKEIIGLIDKIYYQVNLIIDGKEKFSVLDGKIITQLVKYLFNTVLLEYIKLSDDSSIFLSIIKKKEKQYKEEEVGIEGEEEEEEVEDLISSEQQELSQKISEIIIEFLNIVCNTKETVDISYEEVMEKVLRSKEKEKTQITDFLKHLTDEEREIENLFKNSKLERWNKGLQKGLTQYVKDTYDDEREKLEQNAILEHKLGINDLVTNLNKDIYTLDILGEEAADKESFEEQFGISHLAGDDDFGDMEAEEDY